MKKGLALSGGGAKSFVQIGIIKVFEKNGIEFDVITGTSMGSIIGTIYSFTEDANYTEEILLKIFSKREFRKIEEFFSRNRKRNFLRRIFDGFKDFTLLLLDSFKTGLFDSEIIKEKIYEYIGKEIFFENSKKILGIVATDYFTGKTVIFNKGKIIPSLIASCAIPGLVTPVKIGDSYYVDGGVTSNLPLIANFIIGGEIIIGIENNSSLKIDKPENAFDVFVQVEKIKNNYLNSFEEIFADFMINVDLPEVEWFNFSKIKEFIKIGEKTAELNLKKVEEVLNKNEKNYLKEEVFKKICNSFLTKYSM